MNQLRKQAGIYPGIANEKKMKRIKVKAYAKINLVLDVIGRRPDGYHEVEMIMQSVDLHDELLLFPAGRISMEIKGRRLPVDERNIVIRAARALLSFADRPIGARILLQKRIPVGAGLGGGSADAAATLVGLNQLWGLGLSREILEKLAVSLGADVPYCLRGGTVLATGIGERLMDLPALPSLPVFLAKPPFNVSTAHVYKSLSLSGAHQHPDVERIVNLIKQGEYGAITKQGGNLLAEVTLRLYPELKEVMTWIASLGFSVRMSGSGPTLFILGVNSANQSLTNVEVKLRRRGWWTYYGFLQAYGLKVQEE